MVPRAAVRPRRLALVVALTVVLGGCFTGERPKLAEGAATTGDPAADAVLSRLDAAGEAVFTADYTVLTKFGSITTPASVVQAGPARRAVTIGRVRFIISGSDTATCDLHADRCSDTIDVQRVSNLQLTTDFYAASPAARLRRDTELRAGPTRASTETIAGQPATCVVIPITGGESTYCALDSGPLARLDGADLSIELTGYSPRPDQRQLRRPD
jgi:hypothetical protein